ncbi:hypothetical protein D3C84_553700 [compost metagenome]
MSWGYEGEVEGSEPDWDVFCNTHAEHLSVSSASMPPAHKALHAVDGDLLVQLAQWDVWQAPLAQTIQLLETCRRMLCSQAGVSVEQPPRQ